MITQVKAWGNSQGIGLSKELLALAEIKSNDLLDISVIDGNIVLKKQKTGIEPWKNGRKNMEINWVLTKSMIGESLLAGKGGSNVLDGM